jgi:hypothetical protein
LPNTKHIGKHTQTTIYKKSFFWMLNALRLGQKNTFDAKRNASEVKKTLLTLNALRLGQKKYF